jgi:hypothetical protein
MESTSEQLDFLKRVIGEVQDANQVELALELLPIAQKLASSSEKELEEGLELLEEIIASFQTVFQTFNVSKWTNKVLRTKKKKFKSDEEKLAFLSHEICHCITSVHILSLILSQTDIPEMPTILWVDDSPENNLAEREKATVTHGVDIVLARSTDEALTWLAENKAHFLSSDSSHFRIVTDWYRPDEKDGAAESLTQSVREAGWEAPILVYCSENTNPSSLLSEHPLTSTASSDHLLAFYWASMKLNVGSTTAKTAKKAAVARKAKSAGSVAKSSADSTATTSGTAKSSAPVSKTNSSNSTTSVSEGPAAKPKAKATKAKPEEDFMAQFEEEEEEADEPVELNLPPIKAKKSTASVASTVSTTSAASTTASTSKSKSNASKEPAAPVPKAPVVAAKEKEPEEMPEELPGTLDLGDESTVEPHTAHEAHKEEEAIESTLPSVMAVDPPALDRVPTDVVSPPPVAKHAKSRIHDVLASRIPKADEEAANEAMDVDDEEEVVTVVKQVKKAGSGKGSALTSKASGAKITKKNSRQLFGDDEEGDSDFADDGEKVNGDDSDFSISDDGDEVEVKKGKGAAKKTKSKASLSRLPTEPELDTVSSEVVAAATMTPGTKQKKDWNAFLLGRIPSSSAIPGSPLSLLDESSDSAVDHLLATPPAKKTAKQTSVKKSTSSSAVKTTPSTTPQVSPVEKPRPPKPTAPMGPTPIASLSALDDDMDVDEDLDDDDSPLFTKAPSGPPLPIASSSNASENLIHPPKSILIGAKETVPIGQVAEVLLQGKNKDGLNISIGGANITVTLKTGGNAHEFDGYIEDNMNGSYTIKYFPTRLGTYRMIVQANGQHISGSPFSIDVENRNLKKRSASTSIFSLSDDLDTFASPAPTKRPKREESSLPEDSMEHELEATQVV